MNAVEITQVLPQCLSEANLPKQERWVELQVVFMLHCFLVSQWTHIFGFIKCSSADLHVCLHLYIYSENHN